MPNKQKESNTKNENVSGTRLRECRKSKRLTLAELAQKAGQLQQGNRQCSPTNISALESGRRKLSLNYATIFGQILGVRAEYLLGTSPYKTEAELRYAVETKRLRKEKEFHYTTGPLAALQIFLDYMSIEWKYEGPAPQDDVYDLHLWGKNLHMKDFDCRLSSAEAELLSEYIFQVAADAIEQAVQDTERSESNGES